MSAILRTLTSASKESSESPRQTSTASRDLEAGPSHLELLINRMEDGFSKIYMQLEATIHLARSTFLINMNFPEGFKKRTSEFHLHSNFLIYQFQNAKWRIFSQIS